MTDKILIDRAVVEQALEALEMMGVPSPLVFLSDEIKLWQTVQVELRAALEQPDIEIPASVPEGWKLVPSEPTDEMLQAAVKGYAQEYKSHRMGVSWSLYRAMLAAAPQPPTVKDSLTTRPQVEQEPAIYPEEAFDMGLEAIPYYTHPQPHRQPLTELQIFELTKSVLTDGTQVGPVPPIAMRVARAVERAHGITGEQA